MANQEIHSLVSSINTQLKITTITPTAGPNVTIVNHNITKSGRTVTVNFSIRATANLEPLENIVAGLPKPTNNIAVIGIKNMGGGGYQTIFTTTGTIRNDYDTFSANSTYFFNFTYTSND